MVDNPNTNNFYNEEEMIKRSEHIPRVKQDILDKLEDIKNKVESEEPFPEQNQSLDTLVDFSDNLDQILNFWYY